MIITSRKYIYGIDCEDEEYGFWKRVDSDHKLSDEEKKLVMKAACMEEVITGNQVKDNYYDVKPIHIDGVTAALGDDLVWDDDLDAPPGTGKVPVDQKFKDELNKLLAVTTIDVMDEDDLKRSFQTPSE